MVSDAHLNAGSTVSLWTALRTPQCMLDFAKSVPSSTVGGLRLLQAATEAEAVGLAAAVPVRHPPPAVDEFCGRARRTESVRGCTCCRSCTSSAPDEHDYCANDNGKNRGQHQLFSYLSLKVVEMDDNHAVHAATR